MFFPSSSKSGPRSREMAPWVIVLAAQEQGLEFHPQNPYRNPGRAVYVCSPHAEEADTGGSLGLKGI